MAFKNQVGLLVRMFQKTPGAKPFYKTKELVRWSGVINVRKKGGRHAEF